MGFHRTKLQLDAHMYSLVQIPSTNACYSLGTEKRLLVLADAMAPTGPI